MVTRLGGRSAKSSAAARRIASWVEVRPGVGCRRGGAASVCLGVVGDSRSAMRTRRYAGLTEGIPRVTGWLRRDSAPELRRAKARRVAPYLCMCCGPPVVNIAPLELARPASKSPLLCTKISVLRDDSLSAIKYDFRHESCHLSRKYMKYPLPDGVVSLTVPNDCWSETMWLPLGVPQRGRIRIKCERCWQARAPMTGSATMG